MFFNSIDYLVFLPIVICIYFVVPRKLSNIWLLLVSYYFYMCWNAKYIVLILFSTVVTYLCGVAIDRIAHGNAGEKQKAAWKKTAVALSLILNLGLLFFFKYFNFSGKLIGDILRMLGVQFTEPRFDVLLPVGISFYTFQALGYTIDVYRGDVKAEKNIIKYALFVSFFPQLVAGPIERSGRLLQQLETPKKFDFGRFRQGILLMLWGFYLKIVLADRIAIYVDTAYGSPEKFPGIYLAIATALFAFQIYCDFYGYSTIAKGSAKILGIELMDNFSAPYLAGTVSDFWRRWHISLTSWFKDYLYIPLGGSRQGKWKKFRNKLIVFSLSGLWHGADLSFVAWGAINGIYQVVGELLMPIRSKAASIVGLKQDAIFCRVVKVLITFVLVDFTWIFFRANQFSDAVNVIRSIAVTHNFEVLFDGSLFKCGLDAKNFTLMLLCILFLLFVDLCNQRHIVISDIILKQKHPVRCLIITFAVGFLLLFGEWGATFDSASFIYFQF